MTYHEGSFVVEICQDIAIFCLELGFLLQCLINRRVAKAIQQTIAIIEELIKLTEDRLPDEEDPHRDL